MNLAVADRLQASIGFEVPSVVWCISPCRCWAAVMPVAIWYPLQLDLQIRPTASFPSEPSPCRQRLHMPLGLRPIREHVTRGMCTPWSVFQRYSGTGLCAEESLVRVKICMFHVLSMSLFPQTPTPK